MQTGIIVLGHGSKRQETKETMAAITQMVREKMASTVIEEAYLQFCNPTLEETVEKLVQQGITQITVVPYFLFKGVHNTEDIPQELSSLEQKYSQLKIAFAEPLGVDERLAQLVVERAREASPWII